MPKYDPKLLKKIVQSQLISAAKEIDVKNADRISKEMLINAFLEKVESLDEASTPNAAITMYNTIAETFDMVTEPAEEPEEPEDVPAEEVVEEEEWVEKEEKVEEEVKTRIIPRKTSPTATDPKPAPAPPKKAPSTPKKTTKGRFFCAGEAFKSKKYSGTMQTFVQLSDEIHVKSGGKSNVKEATAVTRMSLNLLEGAGLVKVEGDKISPLVAE